MCGIAGIHAPTGQDGLHDAVESMLGCLVHRGPDDAGIEASGSSVVGHRRLAILDLSPSGHQPMASADGRWLVTFNGEIYNFKEIQRELGLADADLRSSSDTEILLEAWSRWGPAALPRLAGQWAFAMVDRQRDQVWLARDRFGEKPLFYHHHAGRLTFASSMGALLRAPWIGGEIDPEALAEYLALRYVVAPRTILAGIRKLPPGHLLRAGGGELRVEPWFQPEFHPAPPRGRRELQEEFGHLLAQAVQRCLVSDVPVALLLSDGLDSNGILAALRQEGRDVAALTYRLDGDAPGEPRQDAAGGGGTRFHDLVVTMEERVARMAEAFATFTEPVGDGAALATWFLIRKARPEATVFLCGHGADELLGGYRLSQDRFRLAALHAFAWLPRPLIGAALDRYLYGDEPVEERRRLLRRASAAEVPARGRYLIHRPLPVDDLAALFRPRPVPGVYLSAVERLYALSASRPHDLDRIQEVLIRSFLAEDILSFADSVAMASSAELRMPYLDKDLAAFVLGLPPGSRVGAWPGRSNTKLILRRWGRGVLPARILRQKKRTFNYGNIRFLLEAHRQPIQDLILGAGALRRELPGLEAWVGSPPGFFRGPREGTLWSILALGAWCTANGVR